MAEPMVLNASLRRGLLIALVVLAADQGTKDWLIGLMARNGGAPIRLTPFFDLVMVWNYGVSFGMLNDGDDSLRWVLVAVALAIVAALVVWLSRVADRRLAIAIGAIIGGALGNLVDRARFGAVADFFDVYVAGWHWPAFNVADGAITLGVAVLLLDALLRPRRERT